ncbi:phage distal tail protein [Microbulbifer pacificus]|uniref:phage distal tail protein n=1 Tax=Microbulbifer pacificus TaxID=407164 RepID=UPI001319F337|nr:phage tail domain-containing protein [Microbulbifer pacificus]
MRRLTYENARGERIVFYLSPILIESLTGIGEVDADLQGQKSPYQDGETHLDVILQPRFIDLEGSILKTDLREMKAYRKYILRVCNPKLGLGKITLELDGDTKEIFGVLDGSPSFPERGRDVWQKFLITWKCPDPYWRDPQEVSRALRAYEGKFTFPFTFPVQFGIEGDVTTLHNDGDTSTPVTISIQGPISKPMIENRTTGKHITVNTTLSPEEILYIDTSRQHKRVEIYKGNQIIRAMGYLDHNSDFWELEVGKNEIRYRADEGLAEAIAAISWHNQYVGM